MVCDVIILVDYCCILQGQMDSYRTLAMKCTNILDAHETVIQQRKTNDQLSVTPPIFFFWGGEGERRFLL